MNWSLALMSISTVFWCQAMPLQSLWIYAGSVTLTAIGKTLWEKYVG